VSSGQMEKTMKIKQTNDSIIYSNQDIFQAIENTFNDTKTNLIIIPHVCNNIGVFGGGFTKYINDNYPIVQENFYLLGKQAYLGYAQFIIVKNNTKTNTKIVFANMIAQNGILNKNNKRPLNYAALVRCMIEVKKFIQIQNKNNDIDQTYIHAPKFGSGLAGGDWRFIEKLVEDIWSNYTICIHSL